jgi:hypothetical protein
MSTLAGSPFNGDLGAIHVHLTVADFVKPSPRKESIARRSIGRHSECIIRCQRAATLNGLDDGESLSSVVRQSELAGTTTVSSTPRERH